MGMIRDSGIDAKLVASIHDEYQFEVKSTDVSKFGILEEAMTRLQKN